MRIPFFLLLSLLLAMPAALYAQPKPAYQFFASNGKKRTYNKVLRAALKADMIFFGELHNDPIAHWLQYELLRDLARSHGAKRLILGMEMFETDQQALIDEYFKGALDRKTFEATDPIWSNYATDYRQIVEFARAEKLPLIASNAPRAIVRQVGRQGITYLDTLPETEKQLLPPLPIPIDYDLPSYAAMRDMMGGHGGNASGANNFIAAQALRDATMAWRIAQSWSPGKVMYHLNGSYHSDLGEGIVWYVKKTRPEAKIFILSTVSQDQLERLDASHQGKADAILVTPSSMTKTY